MANITKTLKAHPEAQGTGIALSENSVRLTSNEDNNILVDERGVTIAGPISLVSSPNQIRVGGLFTFQNSILGMLPSTMATPSPMYVIDPPVKQIVTLVAQVAIMGGLLGMTAAGAA